MRGDDIKAGQTGRLLWTFFADGTSRRRPLVVQATVLEVVRFTEADVDRNILTRQLVGAVAHLTLRDERTGAPVRVTDSLTTMPLGNEHVLHWHTQQADGQRVDGVEAIGSFVFEADLAELADPDAFELTAATPATTTTT